MLINLTAQISNALHWDFAVPRNAVTAQVDGGLVTLRGTVDRPYQRASAEADVLRLAGVQGVRNEIKVRPLDQIDLAEMGVRSL